MIRKVDQPKCIIIGAHFHIADGGFSNRTLWPLFHYLIDRMRSDAHTWAAYEQVNERFARAAAEESTDEDQVWIHDYQLMRVPYYLRRLAPRRRVAFFLHIPFPAYDVYRILPWSRQLLRGLLAADLVGVHVPAYAQHLITCAERLLGCDVDRATDSVHFEGRDVSIQAHPLGIDPGHVETLARAVGAARAERCAVSGLPLQIQDLRKNYTADRPVLLWGGAEVVTPKLASSDLQFLENRKFSRAEICSAFGVPEEIITTTNAAKYDVMSGTRLNFIENRVLPLCRRLEAEDDITVKSIDPTADGWFDTEDHPVLAAARRDRLAAARAGFEMGIPFNELNRAFALGFKPLAWGDKGYIPSTMQPADGREGNAAPAQDPAASKAKSQVSRPREDVFSRLTAALTRNGNHQ